MQIKSILHISTENVHKSKPGKTKQNRKKTKQQKQKLYTEWEKLLYNDHNQHMTSLKDSTTATVQKKLLFYFS